MTRTTRKENAHSATHAPRRIRRTDSTMTIRPLSRTQQPVPKVEATFERVVLPLPQRGRPDRRSGQGRAELPTAVVNRSASRGRSTYNPSTDWSFVFPDSTEEDFVPLDDDEDLDVVDMDVDHSSDSDDDLFHYDKGYVPASSGASLSLARAQAQLELLARTLQVVPSFQEAWCESNPRFRKVMVPARFDVKVQSAEKYNIFWDVQKPYMQVHGELIVEDHLLKGETTQLYSAPPVIGLTLRFWPAAFDNCAPGSTLAARDQKREYLQARGQWHGCAFFSDSLIRTEGASPRVDGASVQGPWRYVPDRAPGGPCPRPAFRLPFVLDVPTALFAHVDFRLIRVCAAVAFQCVDDDGTRRAFDREAPLADFAVEHLRKERHMDGSKLLHPSV